MATLFLRGCFLLRVCVSHRNIFCLQTSAYVRLALVFLTVCVSVIVLQVCALNFSHVIILAIFPYLGFKRGKDPVTW